MKRLLQISLDTLLISVLPIITWLLLGFIVNKDISNVFSLTYPLQFFYLLFVNIFAIGPNITAKKIKDNSIVYSNMFVGTIIVGIININPPIVGVPSFFKCRLLIVRLTTCPTLILFNIGIINKPAIIAKTKPKVKPRIDFAKINIISPPVYIITQ